VQAVQLSHEWKEENMDIVSFVLFFFVVVPLVLIFFSRKRKFDEQILASQKETNQLLAELIAMLKKTP
jgi:hypothetical protein